MFVCVIFNDILRLLNQNKVDKSALCMIVQCVILLFGITAGMSQKSPYYQKYMMLTSASLLFYVSIYKCWASLFKPGKDLPLDYVIFAFFNNIGILVISRQSGICLSVR